MKKSKKTELREHCADRRCPGRSNGNDHWLEHDCVPRFRRPCDGDTCEHCLALRSKCGLVNWQMT